MKNKTARGLQRLLYLYGLKIVLVSVVGLLVGALVSFSETDLSYFHYATGGTSHNIFGYFGATIAAAAIFLMGRAAFLLVPICLYSLLFLFYRVSLSKEWDRLFGIFLFLYTTTLFCAKYMITVAGFQMAGGLLGQHGVRFLSTWFDDLVQMIVIYTFLAISAVLVVRFSFLPVVQAILSFIQYIVVNETILSRIVCSVASITAGTLHFIYRMMQRMVILLRGRRVVEDQSIVSFEREEAVEDEVQEILQDMFWNNYTQADKYVEENVAVDLKKEEAVEAEEAESEEEVVAAVKKRAVRKKYQLPDTSFMKVAGAKDNDPSVQDELKNQSLILEQKLAQFGIRGSILDIHSGPVVTLFEYKPDSNIKLSKIVALEDDLAMALRAMSIRILAPIPGKSVVGFEVANKKRQTVLLASVINSSAMKQSKMALPLILGENPLGDYIIGDLAQMPHLLVAGSTGSGKSVALNTMLISMLCRLTPDELKLIIIDPKRLEFKTYEDIPHLLFPIVTDARKALPILQWVVHQMETRYETMAGLGVRNIFEYHNIQKERGLEALPLIVLIIDELADLMMVAGKEIEGSLTRIAQMARAAGIHMIVATQRPSVDVITGVIKVNFPNRISFKVTSKVDSRTILDECGAEKLLGKGDMLFLNAQKAQIERVHGAYVSDQEIETVVNTIKGQRAVEYLDISEFLLKNKDGDVLDVDDALFNEVVGFLEEIDEISISLLQRNFKIGYNRSARIIEVLESRGLVMPAQGGKMRRVVK